MAISRSPSFGAALMLGAACACSPVPPADPSDGASSAGERPFLDDCKRSPDATPELALGVGQIDYAPLDDGQTLQIERGPQGGYHIWLALRMRNLQQSGSRTTIEGKAPAIAAVLPTYEVVFTFDVDEGGFCKLYGLRYRIDAEGLDYRTLLGSEVGLAVRVTDPSGDVARASKMVMLSGDVI